MTATANLITSLRLPVSITPTFNSSRFSANAGSWNVISANVDVERLTRWNGSNSLYTFEGEGTTLTDAAADLLIVDLSGFVNTFPAENWSVPGIANIDGTRETCRVIVIGGNTTIVLARYSGQWPISTIGLEFQIGLFF